MNDLMLFMQIDVRLGVAPLVNTMGTPNSTMLAMCSSTAGYSSGTFTANGLPGLPLDLGDLVLQDFRYMLLRPKSRAPHCSQHLPTPIRCTTPSRLDDGVLDA